MVTNMNNFDQEFLSASQSYDLQEKLDEHPAECLDAVRAQLAQIRLAGHQNMVSAPTGFSMFMQESERYTELMDSTEGVNNYADSILAALTGHNNRSKEWTSALNAESLTQLSCVQKFLSENQKMTTNLIGHGEKAYLPLKDKSDASQKTFKQLLEEKTAKKKQAQFKTKDNAPSNPSVGFGNKTNHPLFASNPCLSTAPGSVAVRMPIYRRTEPQKRKQLDEFDNEEQDAERGGVDNDATVPFKTAREQLHIDNQRKFGRSETSHQGIANSAYANSKRSLGTRRGLNSKFVPPVINRDNEESSSSSNTLLRKPFGARDDTKESSMENVDERLKNIDPKMIELITNEIMDHGAPVMWDDIAGLEFAKKTIKEIVVWPMLRPDIFTGLRGPPKGLLLFGPPGTGKTLIGKCIASQSKSTFFSISASSLTSKWVGEGEKMVRALFAVARVNEPAVIFLDEIDSLLSQRSDGEHDASRRIKTEFLVQLDGATTTSSERLLVVGATNRPQELDEAARRRFVKRLYIALPEMTARASLVRHLLAAQPHTLSDDELQKLVESTDGYSGADMANLCREAALGPIRSVAFDEIEHITAEQVRPILFEDFEKALKQVRASVSEQDLDLYVKWNRQFGSWAL